MVTHVDHSMFFVNKRPIITDRPFINTFNND